MCFARHHSPLLQDGDTSVLSEAPPSLSEAPPSSSSPSSSSLPHRGPLLAMSDMRSCAREMSSWVEAEWGHFCGDTSSPTAAAGAGADYSLEHLSWQLHFAQVSGRAVNPDPDRVCVCVCE
jgi:hypothetical protein